MLKDPLPIIVIYGALLVFSRKIRHEWKRYHPPNELRTNTPIMIRTINFSLPKTAEKPNAESRNVSNLIRSSARITVPKYDQVHFKVLENRIGVDSIYSNKYSVHRRSLSRRFKHVECIEEKPDFKMEEEQFPLLPIRLALGEINISIIAGNVTSTLPLCKCNGAPLIKCMYTIHFLSEMMKVVILNTYGQGETVRRWFLREGCSYYDNLFTCIPVTPQGATFGIPVNHQHEHEHKIDNNQVQGILGRLENLTVEHKIPILENLTKLFTPFSNILGDETFAVFLLCFGLYVNGCNLLKLSRANRVLLYGAISGIALYKLSDKIPSNIFTLILKWLGDFVTPQGPDEAFSLIVQAVSSLVFCTQVGFKDIGSFGNSFAKMVNHSITFSKSLEMFKDWFLKLTVGIATELGYNLNYLLNRHEADFKDIQLKIHKLVEAVEKNEGNLTIQMRNELVALHDRILALDRSIPESNNNSTLKNSLRGLKTCIAPLLSRSLGVSAANTKPKPFTLFLAGGTGVGKTTLLSSLTSLLISYYQTDSQRMDYKENPSFYCFTKDGGKFFDGATSTTLAFCYHDLFANKDKAGGDTSEARDLLMLCGSNPFKLPMADCALKKDSYVAPYIVTGATNAKCVDGTLITSLTNPDAVARRMNEFCFWVTVNPLFKQEGNDMLDFQKYAEARETCIFPDSHRFQAYDMSAICEERLTGPVYNMIEFLNLLHVNVVKHLHSVDKNSDHIAKCMDHTRKILPTDKVKMETFIYTAANLAVTAQMDNGEEIRGFDSEYLDCESYYSSGTARLLDYQKNYNLLDSHGRKNHGLPMDTICFNEYLANDAHPINFEGEQDEECIDDCPLIETVLFCGEEARYMVVSAIKKYLEIVSTLGTRVGIEDYEYPGATKREIKIFIVLNSMDIQTLEKLSKLHIEDTIMERILYGWDLSRSYFYNVYMQCLRKAGEITSMWSKFMKGTYSAWQWFCNIKMFGVYLKDIAMYATGAVTALVGISSVLSCFGKLFSTEADTQGPDIHAHSKVLVLPTDIREFIDARKTNAVRISLKITFSSGLVHVIRGQNAYFVMTTIVMTPKHFIRTVYGYCNNPCAVKVEVGITNYETTCEPSYYIINNKNDGDVNLVEIPSDNNLYNQDIVLLKFPDGVMKRTDVRKYMVSSKGQLNSLVTNNKLNGLFMVQSTTDEQLIEEEVVFSHSNMSISYNLPNEFTCQCCGVLRPYPTVLRRSYSNVCIMTGYGTATGDCGGIGYLHDPRTYKSGDKHCQKPMLAYLHCAASTDRSFGVKLRREDFDFLNQYKDIDSPAFIERVRAQIDDIDQALKVEGIPPMEFRISTQGTCNEFPHFTNVGYAPGFNMCGKSDLNKTPLTKHVELGPIIKKLSDNQTPAILHNVVSNGVLLEPYKNALLPYGHNKVSGSTLRMKIVSDVLAGIEVSTMIKNDVPSKLTLEQVVEGIDGQITGVNRTSSNGFMHKCIAEHVKKYRPGEDFSAHGMWGTDEYTYGSLPERIFRSCYDENIKRLERGERMLNISTPSLKDELVSREKRLIGKTRTFFTSDKQYFAASKTYKASFAKSVADSRIYNSCQVGTNMYTETDRIYNSLRARGSKALCLDFEKYDKNMLLIAIQHYTNMETKYYADAPNEHNLARKTLNEDNTPIYRTTQNVNGVKETVFCMVENVTNSGDFMTAIMNSCAAKYLIILFCVIILLKYKYGCDDFDTVDISVLVRVTKEVIENVYVITYGDDSVTVPNADYIKYFTIDRISVAARKLGMGITNESDESDEFGYVPIEDITFLGRKLKIREINHELVIDGALRTHSIWKRLLYYRGYYDIEVEKQKIIEVLKESTLHGKEYYLSILPIIQRICNEVYFYTLDITSYETYYCMIKNSDYGFYEKYSLYKYSKKNKCVDILNNVDMGLASPVFPRLLDGSHLVCKSENRINTTSSVENDGLISMSLNYTENITTPQMDEKGRTDTHIVAPETTETWCDKSGTTCYIESGGKVESKVATLVHEDTIASRTDTIAQYLARPQLVSTFGLTTSSVQNDNLLNFYINEVLKNNPMFSQKLAGFELIRGKAIIRLELNASSFHNCMLIVRYIPNAEEREYYAPGTMNIYDKNIGAKIQQPSMYVTADDKVAEIDFPYVGTTPFTPTNYVLGTYAGIYSPWGRVSVDVVLPLQTGTGGTTDISCSVFVSFEDIELANPVVPQTDGRARSKKIKNSYNAIPIIKEGTGPLSKGLLGVSQIADAFSSVPSLAPVMAPVTWGARALSAAASFFGFSNPPPEKAELMAKNNFYYTASAEGTDISAPLAVMYDNAVTLNDCHSLMEKDEMSLAFLFNIRNYMATWAYTTSLVSGDVLYSANISPVAFYTNVSSTYSAKTLIGRQGGPLYYFGRLFSKYRGSLKVKFQFSKTIYHTGKILITLTGATNPLATTLNNSGYLFRTIVDISEQNEFEIDIPHLKQIPWLTTFDSAGEPFDYMGKLEVRVLNTLRCPPTVSSTISCFMTMVAGDDFEYAVPSVMGVPCVPVIPQMNELPGKSIGDAEIKKPTLDIDCTTVGERISSLKLLFNRMNLMSRNAGSATTTVETFFPHVIGGATINTTTGAIAVCNLYGDVISYSAACYGFHRGSMKVLSNCSNSDSIVVCSSNMRRVAMSAGYADTALYDFGPLPTGPTPLAVPSNRLPASGITIADTGGSLFVRSPYYCSTTVSYPLISTGSTRTKLLRSEPESSISWYNANNTGYRTYSRAGGEDYMVSYFLCCPPTFQQYA